MKRQQREIARSLAGFERNADSADLTLCTSLTGFHAFYLFGLPAVRGRDCVPSLPCVRQNKQQRFDPIR